MNNSDSFSPFIVFGPSKSGTTWLQKILDAHSEIRCHFQLQMLPFTSLDQVAVRTNVVFNKQSSPFKGVFKDKEAERQYWLKLKYFEEFRRMSQAWVDELKAGYRNAEDQAYLDELYFQSYRGIAQEVLTDDPTKKIFGTKSYTDLEFLFKVFPAAKVVCIIRDGRDVATSKRYHYWKMGAYFHGEEKYKWLYWLNGISAGKLMVRGLRKYLDWFGESYFERKDDPKHFFTESVLHKLAKDWYLATSYILDFKARFPKQVHIVKYEDLKKDKEGSIQPILQFLGADDSPEAIAEVIEKTDFKRLKKNESDSFFRKGIIGDWKNHFNEKDKQLFKSLTENLLQELNYESDANW